MNYRVKGLDPIVGESLRILILGTFPGENSRKLGRYYEGASCRFWGIINRILNDNQGFLSYAAKTKCLKDHHIALRDIYESKIHTGESSDKGILAPHCNDLKGFLEKRPTIKRVVFNGKTEPDYERVRIMNDIPFEMCVFLCQTSGMAGKKVHEYVDNLGWKEALTIFE